MMPLKPLQRCQVVPLPRQEFQFLIDGREVTRWHVTGTPRPFFYPVLGPSGVSLTRMGHPGAPNHDHHRSLWFAHHDLLGIDFWSENTTAVIEQTQWYAMVDGDDAATASFALIWRDGHDPAPLLKQDLFVTVRPKAAEGKNGPSAAVAAGESEMGEWLLELQADFRAEADGMAFRQSNFGVLGLRVAKSLSVVFGSGVITGANGGVGEASLFGRPNRWIDYSGTVGMGTDGPGIIEGMTLIDHRDNPGHGDVPHAAWHVRDDGWIGPSLSRHGDLGIPRGEVVRCRYLLYIHRGPGDRTKVEQLADDFDESPPLSVTRATRQHRQYEIVPV